ncbi:Fasciclin-like arabinogalactan protein 10 [Abeliophyllum distichum]|uniref:Fasciclin-like arabinogalactan protein 10 n=1 Tax=Abeliophyllum distichum TaxID=126358 RepID=A0ABD1PA51_9LAMI
MAAFHHFFFVLSLLAIFISTAAGAAEVAAHNITKILEAYPEYSQFNSLLSQTKLADEINSREPVTVLALTNGALSSITGKHPLSVVKNELALHVLLDYFDAPKLHKISDGSTLSTYIVPDYWKCTRKPRVCQHYCSQGWAKSASAQGTPIDAPAILNAPAPKASDVNITGLLEKAGCKTFASLIVSTGVLKFYQSAIDKGLTIFAPNDEAFKAPEVPDLKKLSNAEVVSLLQYHALASYTPIGTLKTTKSSISTLATNGAGKYDLTVTTAGDSVSLDTGVDTSRIASTVLDSTPLCIFTVDSLLLPSELFGTAPSPAPGPAPETSPSPAPAVEAPGPAPESATAPSPTLSPPAPPTSSPAGSPSESPTADSQNSTSDNASGALDTPALMKMLLTVSASVFTSILMS